MSGIPTSSEYWRQKDGAEYRDQQLIRSDAGNLSYVRQEQWLRSFLGNLASTLGRPPRVLDFGCGFGRFTRLLLPLDWVEYYGYDFSEKMVEPMFADPPVSEETLRHRVRVADKVGAAFPEGGFDVIFTVSVLIHNPPDNARALLEQMLELLAPGGKIALIENSLSALSVRENSWHSGCWLHDVAGKLAFDLDVHAHAGIIPGHTVYLLSRPSASGRSLSLTEGDGEPRETTLDELHLKGIERLRVGLQGIEEELELGAKAVGDMHDHWELLSAAQSAATTFRGEAESLASEVARLRDERDSLEKRFESRASLRRDIARLIYETNNEEKVRAPRARAAEEALEPEVAAFFQWNQIQDTQFSHEDPRFARVAHVFHMEWKGIRAAAGCLPGGKLAIKAERLASAHEIEQILQMLDAAGIDRVVLHGMSDSMAIVHDALTKAGVSTFLVWHGTTAQWAWNDERRFSLMAISMARSGKVRRFSAIRRGLEGVVGQAHFDAQLLNPVPRLGLDVVLKHGDGKRRTALAPSWNDLRKNLATNLLALESVDQIEKTYIFAKDLNLPEWIAPKVVRIKYPGPHALPNVLRGVDLVMNVTTIDCHPMVDLESMACRVPCVRGPLFLDALEDHAYARLTVVDNPLSVADVASRARYVLSVPTSEVQSMIADYADRLTKLAIDRYAEFTGA